MSRYLLCATILLAGVSSARADPAPHLSLSSDYCAILRAFTQAPDPACPEPSRPGATRSAAPRQDSGDTAADSGYFIGFSFDSNALGDEYRQHLNRLSDVLNADAMAGLCLKLVGHADASGPAAYNQALSERRAKAVQLYLVGVRGVGAGRIETAGRGERAPLPDLPGTDPQNRRVEILAKQRGGDSCS